MKLAGTGIECGIFIVGPKHIRTGQNYTVILSSFEPNTNERNLLLQLDGLSAGGKKLLHLGQPARVQPLSNSVISFPLPDSLPAGSYKLTIDGQNGFKFHQEADLLLAASTSTALVQLSKPIYKPGDVLQFRVIVLGGDLKPPAPSVTATVIVHDPQRNVIRRWTAVSLQLGVFEEQLQIGTVPLLGRYTITVTVTGANEIVSKTFDVREYVLPAFEVAVQARAVPLEKHQRLNLTLSARYYTVQPVRGVATVELYLEDDKLDQRRVVGVYGATQLELPFNEHLSVYDDSQDVRVHVAFTQDETNRTIYKEQRITVYKLPYRVELVKEQPEFRAKVPFDCQLRVRYQDGTPAKGAAFEVKVEGAYTTDRQVAYTSDTTGVIKLTLQPEASSESIDITFDLQIDRTEIRPGDQLQLNMRGRPGAFVALAAYDKSLLQYSSNHDIFWEDVWAVFDKFYSVERNEFDLFHPFYIVPNMPYSIKRGELVELQFIVFNNFPKKYKASVTLFSVDNQTEFVGRPATETSYTKSIEASPDTGVPVAFLIKARKLGEMTVRVDASIEPAKDSIESVIRVIPESLVKREMISRFFCHNTYQNQSFVLGLDFDRKADAGTRKIDFILTPNILTSVMDNLESLLSVPTGCGEQNMMRLVPIVLVLDYLTSIGSADKQLTAKAIGLLRAGYQNQMRYRQPDGSFGLWEKSGGAVFLTAFVGKTLATAAKYITEIEPSMVEQAFDWLAARQHSTGRFDEVGPVFHRDMQGGLRQGIALTSFVLIALLEQPKVATKHRAVIEKGIDYVTRTLGSIEDSYDLAIATYALLLQKHSSGERFLEKLVGLSTVQQNGTERFWARDAHFIETTAYGLLSFVLAEKYVDGTSIMRWLVKQRYTPGSFPRTQDTFVGLKALTKLAEKISPSRNDYSVQLRHAGRKEEFRVTSQDIGTLQHAQQGVDETAQLELHVAGIGFGLLQVVYEYGVDLRNFTAQFVLELQKSVTNANHQLQLEVCSSFTPQLSDGRSNMVLVEVNFPSGYTVEQRGQPITGATKHNPIQKTEVRFGATSVVVYYNSMGPERNCFTITAYRRQKVTLKRPAYVLVHDYYDPKLNAIKMYQVDD
uniref:TEP1-F n=1 Tax=Anopheles melas TaxID=34690 RepID=A0A182THV7_9DIPT